MKKTMLALALSFALPAAVTVGALAEDQASPRYGPRIERLAQRLDLRDQQKSALAAIFAEQGEKRRALREETHARVQGVLTEEQLAQFEDMRQQHKARHSRKFCDKARQQGPQ